MEGVTAISSDAETVVRRFYERVLNQRRLDMLPDLVSADVDYEHIRPGQPRGIAGLYESLAVLFNVIPHLYVRLGRIQVRGATVVVDSEISGSLLIWPVFVEQVAVKSAVHVFGLREGRIASIATLTGFTQVNEEDDDDDGPGPAPPGPRWIPPRPDLSKQRPER
ncbi:MAG: nuclear transport factor 2 family protein [Dermatophilaceae bacterium]